MEVWEGCFFSSLEEGLFGSVVGGGRGRGAICMG